TGCKITCRIMNELIKNIKAKKFKQEGDIKNWLKIQTFLTDNDLSFEPVVACGKNAAVPHYNGNNRLQKGFIIIDYGLRYKGYCTDMTRTLYLGTPTKKDVELYNLILKCQTETIDFIANNYHNGVTGTQAFNYACSILGKHSRYFIHSLGHGIGVKVHELPTLSSNPADKLIKGTVFTVEPGYYNGLGIRIEDDIYLGHHLEVLTKCVPKKLIIVK
ncbi:MAG: M24 family metallopeptidase, partial [Nanoarchaeota archaeon]|nr:M24 family metallopeptidase [Nanoarchaeota archaeon]